MTRIAALRAHEVLLNAGIVPVVGDFLLTHESVALKYILDIDCSAVFPCRTDDCVDATLLQVLYAVFYDIGSNAIS